MTAIDDLRYVYRRSITILPDAARAVLELADAFDAMRKRLDDQGALIEKLRLLHAAESRPATDVADLLVEMRNGTADRHRASQIGGNSVS